MIRRLSHKDTTDFCEFVSRVKDSFEDFFITQNKQRVFLRDYKLIKKILKYQEVYAVIDKEIHAILIIYKEKPYRPYVKILTERKTYIYDLLKYLNWNFGNQELFIKAKRNNPIVYIAQKKWWNFLGTRGQEILLIHRKWEKTNDKHYRKNPRPNTR